MVKKRADLAVYQGMSESYMKELKRNFNIKFASVQLTYGNYPQYDNYKAASQVYWAWKTFGEVGAYHFYTGVNPTTEAKYFLKHVQERGLDKTTELMLDLEMNVGSNVLGQVNEFLDVLYNAGYHNLALYYNESYGLNIIDHKKVKHNPKIWVAKYSTYLPNCYFNIWQYTQSAQTSSGALDLSNDYYVVAKPKAKPENKYYSTGTLFEVIDKNPQYVYNDISLKKEKRRIRYSSGSRFYATPHKYGSIYRLKLTKDQGYVTANTKYVKKIEYK